MTDLESKWFWMADYCQRKGWSPCDANYWYLAKIAWYNYIQSKDKTP